LYCQFIDVAQVAPRDDISAQGFYRLVMDEHLGKTNIGTIIGIHHPDVIIRCVRTIDVDKYPLFLEKLKELNAFCFKLGPRKNLDTYQHDQKVVEEMLDMEQANATRK
jgi:hypothetical protein